MWRRWLARRPVAIAAGVLGLAVLMALRPTFGNPIARALAAALAFSWCAACVLWATRSRR